MYKTKKFGLVSSREENKILAELERDLKQKKQESNKYNSTKQDKR